MNLINRIGQGIGPGKMALFAAIAWLVTITLLHAWISEPGAKKRRLQVGFLPITCHLTCAVAFDRLSKTGKAFDAHKFSAWPDMIEALKGGDLDVAFILAPIAMAMEDQGFPGKIVLLAHRNGTALVVSKHSGIRSITGLKGATVAIPIRYSCQMLALRRLCRQHGFSIRELNMVELSPPDMPFALASGTIDAYIVGEPYAAKAELEGTGRVLCQMRDAWPGFISSVVFVTKHALKDRRQEVSRLIRAFYQAGKWIEGHRLEAARIAAPFLGLPEPLIRYVLLSSRDRVSYSNLIPMPKELSDLSEEMVKAGLIKRPMVGKEIIDLSWR